MIIINLITFENRSYHQRKKEQRKTRGREILHTSLMCIRCSKQKNGGVIGISVCVCVCVVCVCMYEGVYHGRTRANVRVLSVCM